VIYDSGDYQGCLDRAAPAFDYAGRREEQQRLRNARRYRGIGVAAYTEMCGMAPSRRLAAIGFDRGGWESARAAIDSSGRTTVYSGSMSQGHGNATALAQIAADTLQMPVENIDVVQGDTKLVQAGHGTFNSHSIPVGGSSLKLCGARIVEKAKKIAAEMMEVVIRYHASRDAAGPQKDLCGNRDGTPRRAGSARRSRSRLLASYSTDMTGASLCLTQ
jgi:carbon-monoxide dehydrogenase large subunit